MSNENNLQCKCKSLPFMAVCKDCGDFADYTWRDIQVMKNELHLLYLENQELLEENEKLLKVNRHLQEVFEELYEDYKELKRTK